MKATNRLFAGILLCSSLMFCDSHSNMDEQSVARINDYVVTEIQFQNAFKEYYFRTGQVLEPTSQVRKAILDSEFDTYVLAVYANDLGLDEERESQMYKETIRRRILVEEYIDQVLLQDVQVTEKDIELYFLRFNTRLRASHLYANTESEILKLRERLAKGESFEDLAKEVFENPNLANNGGDLGWFTTDDLDISFEDVAYNMNVGDISEPVKTSQGYSIIKLTDAVTRPLLTEFEYGQARENVENYALKQKKELFKRSHLNTFIESIDYNMSALDELWDIINSNYQGMLRKDPEFISNIQSLETSLLNANGFEFTATEFVQEYMASPSNHLLSIQDGKTLLDYLSAVAYRAHLMEEAESLDIASQEEVQLDMVETFTHYLADKVMDKMESEINNTPAELYNVYQEERERFYEPLYVNLQRLVLNNQETADLMITLLNEGASFGELIQSYSVNNEDKLLDGEQGFTNIKNYGFNSPQIASLQVGEVSGIIELSSQEFHIYKVLDREESKMLSFAEAQPMVDKFLTDKKLKQLRKETIEQIKIKHNAEIDLEKLNGLTIQI